MRASVVDEVSFRTQIQCWGAAHDGDIADSIALLCERPKDEPNVRQPWWDRRASDLADQYIQRDGDSLPVPLWWALAGITGYISQRFMADLDFDPYARSRDRDEVLSELEEIERGLR